MTEKEYKLVKSEVKNLGKLWKWRYEDTEDFLQDIVVKLLESKPKSITKAYIRNLAQWVLRDKKRREDRRPEIIYSSDLVDYVSNRRK